MELITVILSSLLLIVSPIGIVVDQVAENAIRARLAAVESLDVRVDNGSSFNLLQGRVDRVRIAGRGVSPVPGLRIAVAELETDPIDLEFASLRRGEVVLDEPLQGAIRLVLEEADINAFLASPEVVQRLAQIKIGALNQAQSRERDRYRIKDPVIEFSAGEAGENTAHENRIRVTLELEDLVQSSNLQIEAEVSLSISAGDRLILVNPTLTANGLPVPPQLINAVLGSLNEQLSLSRLDQRGITARVLAFTIQPESLELAFWISVDPSVTAPTAPTAAVQMP